MWQCYIKWKKVSQKIEAECQGQNRVLQSLHYKKTILFPIVQLG